MSAHNKDNKIKNNKVRRWMERIGAEGGGGVVLRRNNGSARNRIYVERWRQKTVPTKNFNFP